MTTTAQRLAKERMIEEITAALGPLLEEKADFRGRCWGRKTRGQNVFAGVNLVFAIGGYIFVVRVAEDGFVHIEQATIMTALTATGEKIRDLIRQKACFPVAN